MKIPTAAALLASLALSACAVQVDKTTKSVPSSAKPSSVAPVFYPAEGALGPYSAAVRSGDLLFVSGKIGERGQGFVHEVQTALDAIAKELERVGASLRDVVAATVYLTDLDRYAEFNELYAARMSEPYPARVCVQVGRLPGDAQVEIQMTARVP